MVINAQNKKKYLEDLKNWLCELESAPLEEMGAFFRKRLPDYEARMTKFWGEDYKQFARAVPESAKRILDLGCGTGLELDALYKSMGIRTSRCCAAATLPCRSPVRSMPSSRLNRCTTFCRRKSAGSSNASMTVSHPAACL